MKNLGREDNVEILRIWLIVITNSYVQISSYSHKNTHKHILFYFYSVTKHTILVLMQLFNKIIKGSLDIFGSQGFVS